MLNVVSIDQWAVAVMEALGVVGAGLLVALENLFPPIPSEVVLPLAGFTASRGTFDLAAVIVASTLGSVVGALALYGLGAGLGVERLVRIADRMPLMSGDDVLAAVRWFGRWGPVAVLVGRFIPLVRSLISIPAGVVRMNLLLFILLTTIGSGLWNSLFIVLGFVLGENWRMVEQTASRYSTAILLVAVAAIVILIALGIRRWRRQRFALSPRRDKPVRGD